MDNEGFAKEFQKNNKNILHVMDLIAKEKPNMQNLLGYAYINMHVLFIKKPIVQNNNLIIVLPKGYGKSTGLEWIARHFGKAFNEIPGKIYESFLVKEKPEFFHNRILYHRDLLVGLLGLTTKQRQQIYGFFIDLLDSGRYERQGVNKLEGINTSFYGSMARDGFDKSRAELYDSTFADRIPLISDSFPQHHPFQVIEKMATYDGNHAQLPVFINVKRRRQYKIEYDALQYHQDIGIICVQMETDGIMSFSRAYHFISNFMRANALVNERKEVNIWDLKMFEHFLPLHYALPIKDPYMLAKAKSPQDIQRRMEISHKQATRWFQTFQRLGY